MKSNQNSKILFESPPLQQKSLTILLVEDNPGDVVLIREMLKMSGIDFTLKHVSTLKETLVLCAEEVYDVILLDLGLTDSLGLETLKKIQLFNVKSPVVVMTGLDDEDIALESLREGAQDYLVKNRLTSDTILRGIKYGIERKKIQDLLRKNTRQFAILSSTTAAINESEGISQIFKLASRNISMLLDGACTVTIDIADSGNIYTSGTEYIKPWYSQIETVTGLDLNNPILLKNYPKKEIVGMFNDGKVHRITREIKNDPQAGISKVIPGNHAYVIGFMKGDSVYGGALIFIRDIIGPEDISIIEAICNQLSLSLHRRSIEQDLKSSKDKYRKLSKELEKKVKERTRDLESSNYQLNQELIERHMAEEALKKSETRLKEINATKDKFFSIIAHDLKNPFTSLIGSTEILNDNIHRMDTEKVRDLVQILNDSAKSGYEILQNLLDWSRSQTGLLRFNPEKIDLKKLVDSNISDVRLFSEKKGIRIISEIRKSIFVNADKNMMNAILRNLLGNAVKFTQQSGKVTVSAAGRGDEVIITVKDTGIGIPPEKINELFRFDTYYTRLGTNMERGTGLGLKICKEFVEIQGGKLLVESIVRKGSKFIFSVPGREI